MFWKKSFRYRIGILISRFGISTMNFIDSLTLLFLTLSAVKVNCHIPMEGEGPHDVILFMEVYNKSQCQPRDLLVEILQEYPEEVDHIFIPSCVVLKACGAAAQTKMLQCTPTRLAQNVTMEIKRIKLQRQQNDVFMSFREHSACDCRKPQKGKGQKRKRKKNCDKTNPVIFCKPCCEQCSERRKRLFIQDPLSCQCSCKHSVEYCKERHQELNERTCRCDSPRR
ncbi:LOW QUALITY PROTEIN: vascular endothelial growth factor Ab [Aplochiton taeniatus]